MSDEVLIRYCSPTLMGIKIGNLFAVNFASDEALRREIELWNKRLAAAGLTVLCLRKRRGRALIYVFNRGLLQKRLRRPEIIRFMTAQGYDLQGPAFCNTALAELRRRLSQEQDFPHEIGIFLGYPLADVEGFITHRGAHSKGRGFWTVYADADEAERTFAAYRRCRECLNERLKAGVPVEEMLMSYDRIPHTHTA